MRICRECKILKDESEFSVAKSNKDGLNNRCKRCVCNYGKKWNQKHKEEKVVYSKKYRQEHLAHLKKYMKQYYIDNKDRIKLREYMSMSSMSSEKENK